MVVFRNCGRSQRDNRRNQGKRGSPRQRGTSARRGGSAVSRLQDVRIIRELASAVFKKGSVPLTAIAETIAQFKRDRNMSGIGQVRCFLQVCKTVQGSSGGSRTLWSDMPRVVPVGIPVFAEKQHLKGPLTGVDLRNAYTVQIVAPGARLKQHDTHQLPVSKTKDEWLPAWVHACRHTGVKFKQLFPHVPKTDLKSRRKDRETIEERVFRTRDALPDEARGVFDAIVNEHGVGSLADLLGFGRGMRAGDSQAVMDRATRGNQLNHPLRLLDRYRDQFAIVPSAYEAAASILHSGTRPTLEAFKTLADFALDVVQYDTNVLLGRECADIAFYQKHGLGIYGSGSSQHSNSEPSSPAGSRLDTLVVLHVKGGFSELRPSSVTLGDVLNAKQTTRRLAQAAREAMSKQQYFANRNMFATSLVASHFTGAEIEKTAEELFVWYVQEQARQHEEYERTKPGRKPRVEPHPDYAWMKELFEGVRYEAYRQDVQRVQRDQRGTEEKLVHRMIRLCSLDQLMTVLPRMKVVHEKQQWEKSGELTKWVTKQFNKKGHSGKQSDGHALASVSWTCIVDYEQATKVYSHDELLRFGNKQELEELVASATGDDLDQLKSESDRSVFGERPVGTFHIPVLQFGLERGVIPSYYTSPAGKRLLARVNEYVKNRKPQEKILSALTYIAAAKELVVEGKLLCNEADKLVYGRKNLPAQVDGSLAKEVNAAYEALRKVFGKIVKEVEELVRIKDENISLSRRIMYFAQGAGVSPVLLNAGLPKSTVSEKIVMNNVWLMNPAHVKEVHDVLNHYQPATTVSFDRVLLPELCRQARSPEGQEALQRKNVSIGKWTYARVDKIIHDPGNVYVHESVITVFEKVYKALRSCRNERERHITSLKYEGIIPELFASQVGTAGRRMYAAPDGMIAWVWYDAQSFSDHHTAERVLRNEFTAPPVENVRDLFKQLDGISNCIAKDGKELEDRRWYDVYPVLGREQPRIMMGKEGYGQKNGFDFDPVRKVWHRMMNPEQIRDHAKQLSVIASRRVEFRMYNS